MGHEFRSAHSLMARARAGKIAGSRKSSMSTARSSWAVYLDACRLDGRGIVFSLLAAVWKKKQQYLSVDITRY